MPNPDFVRTLEASHRFPEMIKIKVIGRNTDAFLPAVLNVVQTSMQMRFEPRHRLKETPNRRHISITLDFIAGSARQLADAYERLCKLEDAVIVM